MSEGWMLRTYTNEPERNHIHSYVELVYLMEGSIDFNIDESVYTMFSGDIIAVNSNRKHSWSVKERSLLCTIWIDYEILTQYLGQDILLFWCNSTVEQSEYYGQLSILLNGLLKEFVTDQSKMSFGARSLYYGMIDFLLEHFYVKNSVRWSRSDKGEMIYQIMQYIQVNYDRKISLEEIAEKFYMHNSSVSRYFKKKTGMNFVEYINEIRYQHAVNDLLYTDKSITCIAVDNGFTNLSLLNRTFKNKCDLSPLEYRKTMRNKMTSQEEKDEPNNTERLEKFLQGVQENSKVLNKLEKKIVIDTAVSNRYKKIWCQAINMGKASQLLMATVQKHALILKENLGIKYIRITNILASDMNVRANYETNNLNFERINEVLDFIVDNHMNPMLDLADEVWSIQKNIEDVLVKEESSAVFLNQRDAEDIVTKLMDHIISRYGGDVVSEWIFECSYDDRSERVPQGREYDYPEIVSIFITIMKKHVPNARIGVFGHEIHYKNYIIFDFLNIWKKKGTMPDFITLNIMPYQYVNDKYTCVADAKFMQIELEKSRKLLNDMGYIELPIILNKWNTTLSDRNYINDSCAKGNFIIKNMLEFMGLADMVIYDYGSDLISIHYDKHKLLIGGRGLLTKDGLKKPAFYAMQFLNRVGDYIICKERDFIITTNRKGSYYILICNYKNFSYKFFQKEEQEWELKELPELYEDNLHRRIQISLTNVIPQNYCIKRYVVNSEGGDLINEWMKLGGRDIRNKEDIQYLNNITVPKLSVEFYSAIQGEINFNIELARHEISFIHMFNSDLF